MRIQRSTRPGFTLVEMIVATFLLAIGVSAAMLALSTSSQASYRSERVQTAALLAQKQMTEIEIQAAQNNLTGGDQTGDFGNQPLHTVLDAIAAVTNAQYEQHGRQVTIHRAAPATDKQTAHAPVLQTTSTRTENP